MTRCIWPALSNPYVARKRSTKILTPYVKRDLSNELGKNALAMLKNLPNSFELPVACDHGGLELKKHLMAKFPDIKWTDLGTYDDKSVDYPDYAAKLSLHLKGMNPSTRDPEKFPPMGLLICGSGQGMAIRANRDKHIRAALAWTEEVAELSRLHNNANVLCLGGRVMAHDLCEKILIKFLTTPFEGGRHAGRVQKLDC